MQHITSNPGWQLLLILTSGLVISVFLVKLVLRYIIKTFANDFATKLLKDKYTTNLFELFPALKRFSILNTVELSLRAQTGKVIARPLGTPKHFLGYENLMFSPRQMTGFSLPEYFQADMRATIGQTAEKPLIISIPLMISGMSYGLGLSEQAKRALARASNQCGRVNSCL